MSSRVSSISLAAILLIFTGLSVAAQNPVSWSIEALTKNGVKVGQKIKVKLIADIQSGWHLYSISQGPGGPFPTRITLAEGQVFKLAGSISGPRPHVEMDANFGINTETHEGRTAFSIPVTTSADASPGDEQLNINVRYQVCNETSCLPPRTQKLNAPVLLVAAQIAASASPTPEPSPAPRPAPSASPTPVSAANAQEPTASPQTETGQAAAPAEMTGPVQSAASDPGSTTPDVGSASAMTPKPDATLWSFIWIAMTVGALSLLTPCVFPMVPITVSYFTNHASGSRAGAVRDAIIYALGIILTFTALGVALAVVFGAAGISKFAASPWVNLVITAIFFSFAFSLLGAFNLGIPSSMLTRLDALSRTKESSKIIGLLLMGLTFSLTSFTCTAPFVGTLLVMAAQGDWLYPVVGMLAFSTVFALPFFVLALAPQLVSQLPRSGGWMNSVKVVMGLLEIAAAMKFLSNVDLVWHWGIFTREVVLASWVAVTLLITVYLLGKFQLMHDSAVERIGALRLMVALISLSLGFYLLTGLFGRRLGELESFLPPATEASGVAAAGGPVNNGELTWITNDYDQALKQARAENKAVFIDFTGYTCTNCRWMEANMFTRVDVRRELEQFVRVRLYTDGEGEKYEQQQQMQQDKFGTVALPLYAVVSGDGRTMSTFAGLTRKADEFIGFLKQGQSNSASVNRTDSDRPSVISAVNRSVPPVVTGGS